ncbi:CHAD domain-containing protein [Arthrobacter sp. StoSoilB5]|nr:CHAD domain-containing protein [Arthrobacter sp. StoSoilB5]
MGSEVRDSLESYIAFQLAELEGCLPLVAAADQEAVHGARLALRRLRSVLSCYKSVLPDLKEATGRDIRWLARSLGEARDAYVLSQRLMLWLAASEHWLSPDAIQEAVDQLLASSNGMATRVGTGRRWQGIVRATRQTFLPNTEPSAVAENENRPSLLEVVNLLQPLWETVQKSLEAAQGSLKAAQGSSDTAGAHAVEAEDNELLHGARKDIKVLRYSVEAVANVLGAGATAIIQPSMVLQRLLGEQHDSVTGQEWIRNLAEMPGVELLDIEALQSMEQRRIAEAEVGLRAALLSSPIPEPRQVLLG